LASDLLYVVIKIEINPVQKKRLKKLLPITHPYRILIVEARWQSNTLLLWAQGTEGINKLLIKTNQVVKVIALKAITCQLLKY
jgi:hypothetical protein